MNETMTTKHEIEMPDLPEGWRSVEARIDPDLTKYIGDDGNLYLKAKVKLEKIKPRRIVLEETDEIRRVNNGEYYYHNGYALCWPFPPPTDLEFKIWRVVEEE